MIPPGAVAGLSAALEAAVGGGRPSDPTAAAARRTFHLKAVLDGQHAGNGPRQRRPHDAASVRGVLLGQAFAADVAASHHPAVEEVVAGTLAAVGSERPADPGSASAWLNACPREEREHLSTEVAAVLADVRTLWPPLPREHLTVEVRGTRRVRLDSDRVTVVARPDVVLDSHRRDERARAVVVITRTGMPQPVADRRLARASALVHTLATGRPPFRWILLHLTDGRLEVEDLAMDVLHATAADLGQRLADADAATGSLR